MRAFFGRSLLPVDSKVLPLFLRSPCDGEPPGDQRRGIPWPASLDRERCEIDLAGVLHRFLTRSAAQRARLHRPHLPQERQLVPGVAQTFRRLGLLEIGQELTQLA